MSTSLDQYRRTILNQPALDDIQFKTAWTEYQAGGEAAGRRITGSCLPIALSIAENRSSEFPELSVLELVEEANAGLHEALMGFSGFSAEKFRAHASETIHRHLESLATAV